MCSRSVGTKSCGCCSSAMQNTRSEVVVVTCSIFLDCGWIKGLGRLSSQL